MLKFVSLAALLALIISVHASDVINKDIVCKKFERKIDLTTQLAKFTNKITIENTGTTTVKNFLFVLSDAEYEKLSDISAKVGGSKLKVQKTTVSGHPGYHFYSVVLRDALAGGKTASPVEVSVVLAGAVHPFPVAIAQGEKQLVVFEGSHLVPAAYQVTTQSTTLSLPSPNIESYTRYKPATHHDSTVSYGPYGPTPAFSADPMKVHYENNGGFMTITNLERTLEISHWGNIAVEETFDIVHTGAKLKGSFSRYDYQRDHSENSAVRSIHTVLPASARDVYYRDEIGNISTSNLRVRQDSVEVGLRPRFPLFGGWKTHYKLGYNVPSYEYLFQSGDQFALKMRLLDHAFDNMVVEELVTKIILPEGVTDVQLSTPYPVERQPDTQHPTYLDTRGRLVVTVKAKRLTPAHIQDFLLSYKFSMLLMLQEPCLVAAAFLALFLAVMVWVRLDLTLCPDKAAEDKLVVAALCSSIARHQHARAALYASVVQEVAALCGAGQSAKAAAGFTASTGKHLAGLKEETRAVAELVAKVRALETGGVSERLAELVRADREVSDALQAQVANMSKLLKGQMARAAYAEADVALTRQRCDAMARCRSVVALL